MDTLRERYLKQSFISYLTKWNKDDELAMEALLDTIPEFFIKEFSAHLQNIKEEIEKLRRIRCSMCEKLKEEHGKGEVYMLLEGDKNYNQALDSSIDIINSKM